MMSLSLVFWIFLILFGVIGGMRGWAKELLVTISAVLSLFIMEILARFQSPVRALFAADTPESFWIRAALLLGLAFFGYQTPNVPRFPTAKLTRERLADMLLGIAMGVINGYLIVGTLWFFLEDANYPFKALISKPDPRPVLMAYLAPVWLKIPVIYFVVAAVFLFMLVVLI